MCMSTIDYQRYTNSSLRFDIISNPIYEGWDISVGGRNFFEATQLWPWKVQIKAHLMRLRVKNQPVKRNFRHLPKLTTPIWTQGSLFKIDPYSRGPPESPWHESFPTWLWTTTGYHLSLQWFFFINLHSLIKSYLLPLRHISESSRQKPDFGWHSSRCNTEEAGWGHLELVGL